MLIFKSKLFAKNKIHLYLSIVRLIIEPTSIKDDRRN